MKEILFEKTKMELGGLERVKDLARSISPRMHNIVHLRKGQKFQGRSAPPWDIILVVDSESNVVGVDKSVDKLV